MAHLSFDREGVEAFRANDRGPIHMLNLVQLHETARYEDGRAATGAEAYDAYGRLSAPVLARVGGRIAWRGAMELMLIGPSDEAWDVCFITEFDGPEGFVNMIKDPEYQVAVVHRQAAVRDSRLIRMAPLPLGTDFAAAVD